jgi:hypothetical protein
VDKIYDEMFLVDGMRSWGDEEEAKKKREWGGGGGGGIYTLGVRRVRKVGQEDQEVLLDLGCP